MMKIIFKIYRAMLRNRVVEALDCIFFGIADMLVQFFDTILGLNRAPAFFTGWQARHFCFYPPVKYPLHDKSGRKPRFSWLDARGVYTGAVIFRNIPVADVEKLMGPGLKLQPGLITPDQRYPVVYLFGYQQDLRQSWMVTPGVDYLEFAVGVLGVRLTREVKGYPGPFLFMPRLFLNRLYPTILGKMVCYPKVWSKIETTENSYMVKTFGDRKILEGRFHPVGLPGKPADYPCFPLWRMQLTSAGINRFFTDHFVFVDYDWGWYACMMQPLTGTVEVFEEGVPGLPKGQYSFDPLTPENIGAFRVVIPFEWVPPFRRSELNIIQPLMNPIGANQPHGRDPQ